MQGVDVHRKVQLAANYLLVFPCELVGTVNALGMPVRPVQAVLKHRDCKGVGKPWGVKTTRVIYCFTSDVNIWLQILTSDKSLRLTQTERQIDSTQPECMKGSQTLVNIPECSS